MLYFLKMKKEEKHTFIKKKTIYITTKSKYNDNKESLNNNSRHIISSQSSYELHFFPLDNKKN